MAVEVEQNDFSIAIESAPAVPAGAPSQPNLQWIKRVKIIAKMMKAIQDLQFLPLDDHHTVYEIIDQQDLGPKALGLAVPMLLGLFTICSIFLKEGSPRSVLFQASSMTVQFVAALLSISVALISFGVLLKRTLRPGLAHLIILLGVDCIFGAFYTVAGLFLPGVFMIIPGVCFILCLVPTILAIFCPRNRPIL